MTRGHLVQEAKAACSKAIYKAEAWKVSQATIFNKEHGKYMQDLEEQAIREESRSHNDFLFACQVILYHSLPQLKGALATSYHILLGKTPPSPPLIPPQKTSPMEEQPTTAASPTPAPKQSPRPQRQHPSPDPMESMPMGRTTPKATHEGPLSPKRWEIPPWFKTLKPVCAEAFSKDSDMVKEARREFFLKHTYDFTTDGTHDLSRTFKHLAASTDLLGTSIYEIQSSWTGPDELRQANYALWSLPKGLKFLWVVPLKSPRVMGLLGIHDPDALHHFASVTYCLGAERRVTTKGLWSTTYGPYTTGQAWCVIDAMVVYPQHLTLSVTMASMTVANLGEAFPLSSPIQLVSRSAQLPQLRIPQGSKNRVVYLNSPEGRTSREGIAYQPDQPIGYSSIKFKQAAACFCHLR